MKWDAHYQTGANAFTAVPPKGTEKPCTAPKKRGPRPKVQQSAMALETPAERKARQKKEREEKVTAFIHFGGICNFGDKPDHRQERRGRAPGAKQKPTQRELMWAFYQTN